MKLQKIGFIGLGLIGGSIARKVKELHPETCIMAYARTRSTLEDAKADGTIDIILDGIDETLSRCIITVQKALPTPKIYPRAYAQISKKPL